VKVVASKVAPNKSRISLGFGLLVFTSKSARALQREKGKINSNNYNKIINYQKKF